MRVEHRLYGLLVAVFVGGCGRIAVELLPLGDGPRNMEGPLDGGESSNDSGSSTLMPNEPVSRDAAANEAGAAPDAEASRADAGDGARDASAGDASPGDAGVTTDAGTTADAGTGRDAGAGTDAGAPACAGARLFGLCWYLSAGGASCSDTCGSHGGYDNRATAYVGSSRQGGSIGECTQILNLLGKTGSVGEGMRPDDMGFGCHVWPNGRAGDSWWLDEPDFSPNVSGGNTQIEIACGCQR